MTRNMCKKASPEELLEGIKNGQRVAIGKMISFVENEPEKAQEILKTETQEFLKAEAEEKAKTQVKPPSLITDSGKWGGYDLVWEIEPGKLLLVKDTSKQYAGHIYYVREQLWLPLDELTPEQLREVLNKGKFPIIKK